MLVHTCPGDSDAHMCVLPDCAAHVQRHHYGLPTNLCTMYVVSELHTVLHDDTVAHYMWHIGLHQYYINNCSSHWLRAVMQPWWTKAINALHHGLHNLHWLRAVMHPWWTKDLSVLHHVLHAVHWLRAVMQPWWIEDLNVLHEMLHTCNDHRLMSMCWCHWCSTLECTVQYTSVKWHHVLYCTDRLCTGGGWKGLQCIGYNVCDVIACTLM